MESPQGTQDRFDPAMYFALEKLRSATEILSDHFDHEDTLRTSLRQILQEIHEVKCEYAKRDVIPRIL